MGAKDLQDVKDAVAKAKSAMVFQDWKPVVHAVSRLAMPDMLKSMDALSVSDRDLLVRNALAIFNYTSSFHRIEFAAGVIDNREIYDLGLPDDQVNDGREFLGCTRLDDAGVQSAIQDALNKAPAVIRSGEKGTEWASLAGEANQCCGVNFVAWKPILVDQRRVPGASLVSNLAAAAHYMLAQFHVCAAKSTVSQMRTFVDGYELEEADSHHARRQGAEVDGSHRQPAFPARLRHPQLGLQRRHRRRGRSEALQSKHRHAARDTGHQGRRFALNLVAAPELVNGPSVTISSRLILSYRA